MSNVNITPNMSLTVPVTGQEPGPDWANDINNSLGIIDGHNHAPGSGVLINPDGLDINAALAFNFNPATNLAFVNITAQGTGIPVPTNYSVYASGVDLYYKDGSGNAIQITSGGAVNATSSGISSGTASAAFVSSTLVVLQSVGVGAPIDAATYILRYNGSYPSPSGNAILLEAPSSLASQYAFIFPASTPAASGAFLTSSTGGNLSYTNVDNATLTISGAQIQVATGGIQQSNLAVKTTGTTVTAGNVAISNSSGSFSTSSTGTPVTNLSVSLVTLGSPVHILLVSDGTGSEAQVGAIVSGGANANSGINLLRNGGIVSSQLIQSSPTGATANIISFPPSSFSHIDASPAGTNTYTVTVDPGVSNSTFVNFVKLVVYEL